MRDCSLCKNFIYPELDFHGFIKTKAKCSVGMKTIFRFNKLRPIESGWFRNCEKYKPILNDNSL